MKVGVLKFLQCPFVVWPAEKWMVLHSTKISILFLSAAQARCVTGGAMAERAEEIQRPEEEAKQRREMPVEDSEVEEEELIGLLGEKLGEVDPCEYTHSLAHSLTHSLSHTCTNPH